MAKTNWSMNDVVMPADLNLIGQEINNSSMLQGQPFSDFSDFVLWYGDITQSNQHVKLGTTSLRVATDSSNSTSAARLRFTALELSKVKSILIRFYVEDINAFSNLQFRISNVDNMSSYLQFARTVWQVVTGWNELYIPLDRFTQVGTIDKEALFTTLQISVTERNNSRAIVHFDALFLNRKQRGKVMFHFDDGWSTQYTTAFPIMRAQGLKGNIGVISGAVGTSSYMTLNQLKHLNHLGWSLFNHTKSHADLSTLSKNDIRSELTECRDWLVNNGIPDAANLVAYPYGRHNDNVLVVLEEEGFRAGRMLRDACDVYPPIQPYSLKSIDMYNGIEDAKWKPHLEDVVSTGSTLILLFHKIESAGNDSIIFNTDKFRALVDYVTSLDLDVVTWKEWMDQAHDNPSLLHANATLSASGLMSAADKTKLEGVAAGAQVNPGVATTSAAGLMSAFDKSKLDGVAAGANNYTHPTTHLPSIIVQDSGNRFVTDAEKIAWNAKAGTTVASISTAGLMSSSDKSKLDAVAAGANNYTHPSSHPPSIITQDSSNRFVTDTEKAGWNAKASTAIATGSSNGLMPAADKAALNAATNAATASTLVKRDSAGRMKVAAPTMVDDVPRQHNIMVPPYAVTAGTGAAYTAAFSPAFSVESLIAGARVTVKLHIANIGASTLNVNGIGAKPILKSNGSALSTGNLKLNSVYTLVYDGTNFILQGEGGEYGTAVASDVVSGKTIGTETGLITGTIVEYGGEEYPGYHRAVGRYSDSGRVHLMIEKGLYRQDIGGNPYTGIFSDDPNFIASNIRKDTNIFGLAGTLIEGKRSAIRTGIEINNTLSVNDYAITGIDFVPKTAILYFPYNNAWSINGSTQSQGGLVVTNLTQTGYYVYGASAQVQLSILNANGTSCLVKLTSSNNRIGSGGAGTLILLE